MFLKQSLLILLFLFTAFALKAHRDENGKRMHYCPSCATKGYVMKRWLMQHSESGQSMGWFDWRGTNCEEGLILVSPCSNACITVIVEKQRDVNEYEYVGSMQECSDQLIHESPDLPEGIDFKEYNETEVYISKRMQHRITYNFTQISHIDLQFNKAQDIEDNEIVYLTETKMTKLSAFTTKDGVTIGAVIFSVALFIGVCVMWCRKKSSPKVCVETDKVYSTELQQPRVIPMKRAKGVEDISASLAVEKMATTKEVAAESTEKADESVEEKEAEKEDSPV